MTTDQPDGSDRLLKFIRSKFEIVFSVTVEILLNWVLGMGPRNQYLQSLGKISVTQKHTANCKWQTANV